MIEDKSKTGYLSRSGAVDVEYWMEQTRKGIEFRKKFSYESQWEKWRGYYRGSWAQGIQPVNLYFKMIRTLVPRIYYRNPSVSIVPSQPGVENMLLAKLLQRIDNKMFDTMGVKGATKRAIQNAIMFGTGWGNLGFGSVFAPSTSDPENEDNPDYGHSRRSNFTEYFSNAQPYMPWYLSVHPGDMIVPVGCSDFDNARWMAKWIQRPLTDLQDDRRFKNTSALKSSKSSFPNPDKQSLRMPDVVDLVEIHDKKDRVVFVLAPYGETSKKVLFEDDDDMQFNGSFPFYPLVFNEDDQVCWGVPDSKILEPNQKEANETRTLIMKHRRISIVKMLAKLGSISADEESKLISDDVNAVVKMSGEPNTDVREINPGPIPPGLIESLELIEQETQELLGLGTNQFGEYAPGSADRSATEANIVAQATQIRIDERRDMVADMLTRMTNDLHNLIFERWTNDVVVDIAGPWGQPVWVKFRPEVFKKGTVRFDVRIDPDTSLPETKQIREQRAIQTYGLLRQNPFINPIALTQVLVNNLQGVDYDNLIALPNMGPGGTQGQPIDIGQALNTLAQLPAPDKAMMAQWLTVQAQVKPQGSQGMTPI